MVLDIDAMLGRALTEGAEHSRAGRDYVMTMVPVGDIVLPTGRVVGCDPLVSAGAAEPFTVTVAPGRFGLRGWVAVEHVDGVEVEVERRTAALQLVVRGGPVARWEPALLPGQEVAALDEDEFFVHPVDTGASTLADEVALAGLARWDYEQVEAVFVPVRMPAAPGALGAVTDDATGANVIAVSAGDGSYPTFVGYTAAGGVASFVTTFLAV
jgi:hypothetical protein